MGAKYDISVWKGTALNRKFKWANEDKTPILLDGYEAYMHIRRTPKEDAIIEASTKNGKIKIVPDKGKINIQLSSKDMDVTAASYKYDLVMVQPDGESRLLLYGTLHVYDTVTKI